ncbi:MAG: hypothetical protein E6767_20700, partial [Dysgonomonas sp.]|nr:hypothetical protein [Dysgonomonas sp.]
LTPENADQKLGDALFTLGGSTPLPTEEVERIKKLTFADLWNQAAGQYGRYNEETELFEYVGLTDIGYEEAIQMYNYSNGWSVGKFYAEKFIFDNSFTARANLPLANSYNGGGYYQLSDCISGSNLEILNLQSLSSNGFGVIDYIGKNCFNLPKCKRIMGIIYLIGDGSPTIISSAGTGMNMPLLEDIQFRLVRWNTTAASADLSKLASINLLSLETLVNRASPDQTGVLTITLHADAYAHLTPELIASATAKNITFATA